MLDLVLVWYSKFYFSYKRKNTAPGWDLKEVKGH